MRTLYCSRLTLCITNANSLHGILLNWEWFAFVFSIPNWGFPNKEQDISLFQIRSQFVNKTNEEINCYIDWEFGSDLAQYSPRPQLQKICIFHHFLIMATSMWPHPSNQWTCSNSVASAIQFNVPNTLKMSIPRLFHFTICQSSILQANLKFSKLS